MRITVAMIARAKQYERVHGGARDPRLSGRTETLAERDAREAKYDSQPRDMCSELRDEHWGSE